MSFGVFKNVCIDAPTIGVVRLLDISENGGLINDNGNEISYKKNRCCKVSMSFNAIPIQQNIARYRKRCPWINRWVTSGLHAY